MADAEQYSEEKQFYKVITSLLIKLCSWIISRRNSSAAKNEMWINREKKLIKQEKAISDDFEDK